MSTNRVRLAMWLAVAVVVVSSGVFLGVHYLRTDSGVSACKRIAAKMTATDNGRPWPLDSHARADFAGSGHAQLRTAGTTMADFLTAAARTNDNAPDFADTLVADYTNLSHACGQNGVTMPPLGFPGD